MTMEKKRKMMKNKSLIIFIFNGEARRGGSHSLPALRPELADMDILFRQHRSEILKY